MTHHEWVLARVTCLPDGEAPKEIREQWVGVAFSGRFLGIKTATGIISGAPMQPRETFAVPYGIAIQTLEAAGRISAAHYFRVHMERRGIHPLENLLFGAHEVEIVSRDRSQENKSFEAS